MGAQKDFGCYSALSYLLMDRAAALKKSPCRLKIFGARGELRPPGRPAQCNAARLSCIFFRRISEHELSRPPFSRRGDRSFLKKASKAGS